MNEILILGILIVIINYILYYILNSVININLRTIIRNQTRIAKGIDAMEKKIKYKLVNLDKKVKWKQ